MRRITGDERLSGEAPRKKSFHALRPSKFGGDVGWTSSAPGSVSIGGRKFLVAGEAIEEWESRLTESPFESGWGSRGPETDWSATTLLLLARPQLAQAVTIL